MARSASPTKAANGTATPATTNGHNGNGHGTGTKTRAAKAAGYRQLTEGGKPTWFVPAEKPERWEWVRERE